MRFSLLSTDWKVDHIWSQHYPVFNAYNVENNSL
jgi:hypothetical protein